jgi:methionyl-tRNA formyltransferase
LNTVNLAFAGTPDFAVPALEALAASRHRIAGVFTQPDRRAGRGREWKASPVKLRAQQLGLPVFQPETFRSEQAPSLLAALKVDALIVVAYGLILPKRVLDIPRLGCFNIHASLLPRWRGAAPIQRAILAGDATSGITIMRMEPGLDTGPILATAAVPIEAHDTSESLHDKLAPLGGRMMCETLDALASGPVAETVQPTEGVTYAAKIEKSEGEINWTDSAASIERRVRAFNPWPVAQTRLAGKQLRIWESQVLEANAVRGPAGSVLAQSDAGIDVACGEGVLRLTRLQSPGRAQCAAAEFLKSHTLLNVRLGP